MSSKAAPMKGWTPGSLQTTLARRCLTVTLPRAGSGDTTVKEPTQPDMPFVLRGMSIFISSPT
eukprot:8534250-Pyramimonas_sp.AAC.1